MAVHTSTRWTLVALVPLALVLVSASQAGPEDDVRFFWRVDVADQRQTLQSPTGDLDLGIEGWSCGYQVDPLEAAEAKVNQFGVLACQHLATGKVVDTLVLCQSTENKPTDHGGGSLIAVTGDQWPGNLMAMSCSTEDPPKERPTVQLPADPNSAERTPGGLGMRTETGDSPSAPAQQTEDVPEDGNPSGPTEFLWRLEISDPGRHMDEIALTRRQGPVDHGLAGWSCSHAIQDVPSSSGSPAEAGFLLCDSGEGVTFATAVACTPPSPDSPHVCQVGSQRFTDGGDGVRALVLKCKDAANPGCF